jgi:flagellar biosynthesis regulator FlaF
VHATLNLTPGVVDTPRGRDAWSEPRERAADRGAGEDDTASAVLDVSDATLAPHILALQGVAGRRSARAPEAPSFLDVLDAVAATADGAATAVSATDPARRLLRTIAQAVRAARASADDQLAAHIASIAVLSQHIADMDE